MQKIIHTMILFFLGLNYVIADSVVSLSGGGSVAAKTSVSISLNGLMPSANYSVVCYIDTIFPFQYILLGSNFADATSTITSYSINGNYGKQDQLAIGHNTVVINGQFTNPTTGYIVFTNLDQTNPFTVNNCFGISVSVP